MQQPTDDVIADHPVGAELAREDASDSAWREGSERRAEIERRRALIEHSNLFDPDWYRRHHPAAWWSELDPLDHYLFVGVAARASPGPLFDASAYLRRVWHLRPGIDDPLTHYLQHGRAEDCHPVSVVGVGVDAGVADLLSGPVEPMVSLTAPARSLSLAVVVHVFYVELFAEICLALSRIPYRFTLLVTTDEPEKAALIRAEFASQSLDAFLLVHVGPNRGRNFAPFLLGFRDTIAAHELVLHLHTKKSLYTGSERTAWRRALLRTLLPATPVISGLIERFAADPKLGVLIASPGEEMHYWGYHWLSNRNLAQPLFDRLGLSTPVPEGLFDYPIGGMFWARTSAIGKLLDHAWSLDDFPPELGQTDGTIMHAIERIIVLMAAEAGYGFVELDYERGLCRRGWSGRNLSQYRATTRLALLNAMLHVDTVSFDVFDTLLTRICLTPQGVPRFIGFMAARRFPGADDYVARRRAAEIAARADRDNLGDVDLDEIHARFAADAGPAWTAAAIAFVQHEEVALDLRALRPRTIMIEALEEAAQWQRVVLTSDSYLPRRRFDAMLAQFGILPLINEIYLSSERRARKDRGDLWSLVASLEQRPSSDDLGDDDDDDGITLLHVGDNEQSDIQQTAHHVIRHFHVLSPLALFRLRGLDPGIDPEDRRDTARDGTRDGTGEGEYPLGDEILLGPIACSLFNSPYVDASVPGPVLLSEPEAAGAVLFGPLLFAFVAWLSRHPTLRHLDRLFFVSREGYFLKRLYDAVRVASRRDSGPDALPPSAYFHASRRSTLAAAQGVALDPESVLRGAGFTGSLGDFLSARLGFVPDAALRHQHQAISLPRDTDLVRCMMQLMHDPIAAQGRNALDAFTAYAAASGMTSPGPHGFVDVGYSATMQTAIQTALGRPLIGLYMGISTAATQVRAGGGHAFGAFVEGDVGSFTGGYGLMLEAFLTAPHGQVIGYDATTAPPSPLFGDEGMSQRVFPTLERIYQGVEEYALTLLACYGPDLLDLPFRPQAATAMLQAFRDGRLALSPELMAALSVEDDFCGNGEIPVFSRLST